MKLKQLTLTNFQGIRSFTLDTDGGQDVSVFADNAVGKTTIYNAFLFLLFEKNSLGAKDFDIKTRDENGAVIPAINHEVEAVLEINGKDVTLKRVYMEKYTKKRGSAKEEFTGHVTEHFINGVPKSKGEYQEFIDSIAPEKLFMCLTSPTYFNEQLSWQERRKMLLGLCPEINDQDILCEMRFADLLPVVDGREIEDVKKIEMATRKKINEELNGIPGRIDEATRAIPENATGNLEALATKAQKIAAEIEPLRVSKISIISGGQVAELQKQLSEIDHDILVLKNKHLASSGASCEEGRKQLHDLANKVQVLELQIDADKGKVSMLTQKIEGYKAASRDIASQWTEKDAQQFTPDGICKTCGQKYPEDLIAQQESDFNREKSQALELIVQSGRTNETSWKECEAMLAALTTKITTDEQSAATLREQAEAVRKVIDSKATPPAVETLPEFLELDGKRQVLTQQIVDLQAGNQSALAEVDQQIAIKQSELDEINRTITTIETAEIQRRRVDELKAREKELAKQFEQSEKILFLIEQFIQAKVSKLEESINQRFNLVNWKLFSDQINGGLSETCICTVNGVPYGSINNGARIQAGAEIVAVFQDHYSLLAPVFFDNRESVTSLPPMPCQVISLIVSEADKALRVEVY
jgi:hypothetical protein